MWRLFYKKDSGELRHSTKLTTLEPITPEDCDYIDFEKLPNLINVKVDINRMQLVDIEPRPTIKFTSTVPK
jgi:hypothetical protein